MKNFYKKGITLLEVLMAVAILGIIVSVALPQFSKIKENIKKTAKDIIIEIICLLKKFTDPSAGTKVFMVKSPAKIIGAIKQTRSQSIFLSAFSAINLI